MRLSLEEFRTRESVTGKTAKGVTGGGSRLNLGYNDLRKIQAVDLIYSLAVGCDSKGGCLSNQQ